jgi:mono/diheme cytochrome c family protein
MSNIFWSCPGSTFEGVAIVIKGGFKDPEKQDFGKLFLILGALTVAVLGWELYEETIGRQPWIGYQNEFKKIELEKLRHELAQAEKAFEEKQKKLAAAPENAEPTSVARYRSGIARIEEILRSPSYRQIIEEKERLTNQVNELGVEHRFIKADLDAAYYTRDSALESGEKGGAASAGEKEVISIQGKLSENEKKAAELTARLNEVTKKVELAESSLQSLKSGLDKETSHLATLKERIAKLESSPAAIQQVVVSGLGEYERVDRCTTCHQGIDRPDFAGAEKLVFRPHSNHEKLFKSHPIDKTGCTSCHDGQGRALSEKEAHEGDKHFHTPMLKGKMVQASCARCHENAPLVSAAPVAAEGAAIFEEKGCAACHKVDGSPYITIPSVKLGPDLKAIKAKVRPEWLVAWIQDPKKFDERTLMPQFGEKGKGLAEGEAVALASYLTYSSGDLAISPAAHEYANKHSSTPETVSKGKRLFESKGCLGCHDQGPNQAAGPRHLRLDRLGEKVTKPWVYSWIENPKAMSETTIMPRFPLSKEEISCLGDYLLTLKLKDVKPKRDVALENAVASSDNIDKGKSLIKKYGCYSCHNIPGFERNLERIGPELSDFAAKDENLLFWGNKDVVPHEKRNWYTWTKARLDEPKAFETDRIAALMPNMHLSPEETEKMLVFLKTLSSERTIAKQHRRLLKQGEKDLITGHQLIDHYGCNGCHSGYEPEKKVLAGGFHSEPQVKYGKLAPNLGPEGDRVRADWLSDFLEAPYVMRPYLPARMPAFPFHGDDKQAIVNYFRASAIDPAPSGIRETAVLSAQVNPERGKQLLSKRQCVTCHMVGGKELPAASTVRWYHDMNKARQLAPDLASVSRKLNPKWANRWMANPHAIMPDTTMPNVALTDEESSAIRIFLSQGQGQKSNTSSVK